MGPSESGPCGPTAGSFGLWASPLAGPVASQLQAWVFEVVEEVEVVVGVTLLYPKGVCPTPPLPLPHPTHPGTTVVFPNHPGPPVFLFLSPSPSPTPGHGPWILGQLEPISSSWFRIAPEAGGRALLWQLWTLSACSPELTICGLGPPAALLWAQGFWQSSCPAIIACLWASPLTPKSPLLLNTPWDAGQRGPHPHPTTGQDGVSPSSLAPPSRATRP